MSLFFIFSSSLLTCYSLVCHFHSYLLSYLLIVFQVSLFASHLSPRRCPSTAGCCPPSVPSIIFCLFQAVPSLLCRLAIFCFVVPLISSLSLVVSLEVFPWFLFLCVFVCLLLLLFFLLLFFFSKQRRAALILAYISSFVVSGSSFLVFVCLFVVVVFFQNSAMLL